MPDRSRRHATQLSTLPSPARRRDRRQSAAFSVRRTMDEFVEPADLPVLGAILVQEREIGLIEFPEELVPVDRVEGLLSGFEVDAKDARVAVFLGGSNGRGTTAPLLRPFPDRIMLRGGYAVGHL